VATEASSHRFTIEEFVEGSAIARLEPMGEIEPPDILAVAHRSSRAALHSVVSAIHGGVRTTTAESNIVHLREPNGPVSAAAVVDCDRAEDVADDVRLNGTTHARVKVAVVDDAGESIALGYFLFYLALKKSA